MVFAPQVLAVFRKYRQRFCWQPESGGILLGLRRGRHLEVLTATEPSSHDKRSAFFFVREAEGHAEVAEQAWIRGGRQVDYLGEWHTHPQTIPIPSSIDRAEWYKLVQKRPEKATLLTVVVGAKELHVEVGNRVGYEVLESILPMSGR
ncbi:Mov34/MPN/PAD-1 family protein [Accumulibacter sp.]|uniref:Mov34/MPN/PAD-1 family protein n=1 Tax=Accumulibacter sp. TaxID=2053492 RepID=UPI001A3B23A2|nr:Mov34/MPN/PAD-1 family protein [Accumulibacter sp.]MBL8399788.1 Mov34/MPN/PAD-1 family protein [Accumulibacter sp.]